MQKHFLSGSVDLPPPTGENSGLVAGREMVGRLRTDIISGHFRPNTRLKFADMTKRYSVSVGTLREALSHLVSEGFVTLEINKGFAVAPISREELMDVTSHYIDLEQRAIASAIEHGTDEWEGEIVSAHHKLRAIESKSWEQRVARHSEWVIRHRRFHESLVAACQSVWLFRLRSIMFDQMERYRFLTKMAPKGMKGRKKTEHRKLMEAVIERDASKASELIDTHIRDTSERAVRLLEDLEKGELQPST